MPATKPAVSYVYVIVRTDLPQPHLTVQAAHAAIAATHSFNVANRTHPHLVVCGVANENELNGLFNRLKEQGVPCCGWYEDDMNDSLTAVATGALRGCDRKPLKRLKLLA